MTSHSGGVFDHPAFQGSHFGAGALVDVDHALNEQIESALGRAQGGVVVGIVDQVVVPDAVDHQPGQMAHAIFTDDHSGNPFSLARRRLSIGNIL